MNIADTSEYVERWEGRRTTVYTDSLGHPTIGVGFNLDRPGARGRIEDLGINYDDVRSGAVALSNDQVDSYFRRISARPQTTQSAP